MTDHLIIYSDRGLSIQKWPVHRTKTRPSCRISPLGMEHPAQAKRPNRPSDRLGGRNCWSYTGGGVWISSTITITSTTMQRTFLHAQRATGCKTTRDRTIQNQRELVQNLFLFNEEVHLTRLSDIDLISFITESFFK